MWWLRPDAGISIGSWSSASSYQLGGPWREEGEIWGFFPLLLFISTVLGMVIHKAIFFVKSFTFYWWRLFNCMIEQNRGFSKYDTKHTIITSTEVEKFLFFIHLLASGTDIKYTTADISAWHFKRGSSYEPVYHQQYTCKKKEDVMFLKGKTYQRVPLSILEGASNNVQNPSNSSDLYFSKGEKQHRRAIINTTTMCCRAVVHKLFFTMSQF